MKKILLLGLALGLYSCSQEDCTRAAVVHNFHSFPNTFVVHDFPYDCKTGKPDMKEAKKRDKTVEFVSWL